MPTLRKKPAVPERLTAAVVAARNEKLTAERDRLWAEGWDRLRAALDLLAECAAGQVLCNRLRDLEAAQDALADDIAEHTSAAAIAGERIAPLRSEADRVDPTAAEIAHVDAVVSSSGVRLDELVDERRCASFEMRANDVAKIDVQVAGLRVLMDEALAGQRAVHDRAAEAFRLRVEARAAAAEQERLLDLAAEKRDELNDLPRKVHAQAEQADRLRETLAHRVREEPTRFIQMPTLPLIEIDGVPYTSTPVVHPLPA